MIAAYSLVVLLWMGSQQHIGCYPDGSSGRYELVCEVTPSSAEQANRDYAPGSSGLVGNYIVDGNRYEVGADPDLATFKTEPIDVPAIQEMRKTKCTTGYIVHGFDVTCRTAFVDEPHTTCADKSRILLTDESGGKHCIKFPKEQP